MSLVRATLITTCSRAISDWVGHRPMLIISYVLYFVSGILWSPNVYVLLLTRLLDGFGIGLAVSLVSIYVSKTAPPEIRGLLNTLPQFTGSGGMFLSYCTVFRMSLMNAPSWRLMLEILSIPSVIYFFLTIFFLPESPRWLEYIIGPMNDLTDEHDIFEDKDQIKIYGLVTRQSTVGLVSRHGSLVNQGSLVDPLVTLFGSVHEKLPETGSMRSTLFPHFGSKNNFILLAFESCSLHMQFSGINGVLCYTTQILEEAGVGVLLSNLGLSSSSTSSLISGMTSWILLAKGKFFFFRLLLSTLLLSTIPVFILTLAILVLDSPISFFFSSWI
ncbi:hypothetical protein UlMin_035312 [Ulmus minor]